LELKFRIDWKSFQLLHNHLGRVPVKQGPWVNAILKIMPKA
jgi:hypothetical protein